MDPPPPSTPGGDRQDDPRRASPGCAVRLVAVAFAIVLVGGVMLTFHLGYRLTEYLLVNVAFGTETWAAGIRIVDDESALTDGRPLSPTHRAVVRFGPALFFVVVVIGGLALLGSRLRRPRQPDGDA